MQALKLKVKILSWMVKNNVRGISDVGKLMNEYYLNTDFLVDIVNKNSKPARLFK